MRSGALGVDSDKGVEGKKCRGLALVEDPDGVVEVGRIPKGNGGGELAAEMGVVDEAAVDELGVDLLELPQGCDGVYEGDARVLDRAP